MPEGSEVRYSIARIRGGDVAGVGSSPDGGPPAATWNTYIWVESADQTAEKARAAGGTVTVEPYDVMDFGRMAVLTDPEGAAFCVWEAKEHKGARVVNEHGSLNFNGLATRDAERAKAFYGEVFGWQVLSLPSGPMWALPGYGDHLEEKNPGLKKGMEEMGAPKGFADVVASMNPIPEDQPDTPPHWSLTFAVDDADAIAAKAQDLGGKVITPPFDAPWVRMGVIADPQGATFVASKFVPENRDLEPQGSTAGAA